MHAYISLRELPKRFVSIQFLLVALWLTGEREPPVTIFCALALIEALAWHLNRTMPEVGVIPAWRVLVSFLLSTIGSAFYYLPAVLLVMQSDFALVVSGLIWIVAAMSANLVMYSALRAYYWATAAAGIPAILSAAFLLIGKAVVPAQGLTWLLPVSVIVLFIANTLQQLWEFRDTQYELSHTRAKLMSSLRRMEHMSLHDGLTGLGNRVAFNAALQQMLEGISRDQKLAVFMIDLNEFKPINDTYGHSAGDAVLEAVGHRVQEVLRPGAQAFRLGGDEFAVLTLGRATEDFQALGDRLVQSVTPPVIFKDKSLFVGASVGIGVAVTPYSDPTKLCARADRGMYLAKSSKSRTAVLGRAEGSDNAIGTNRREALLRALRNGEIGPHYQPRVSLDDARVVGFQALARWDAEGQGVLPPDDFLPELEHIGLLPELTLVMLRAVLADLTVWHAAGLEIDRVSINMPVVSLATESRRQEIDWLLAEFSGFESRLAFEVSEDAYLARASDVIASTLRHFRSLGIEIHLDDFGTGYASYTHLRHFTPDQIKIDGSLIEELASGTMAASIVRGIVNIAHGIGAKVVAEEVEAAQQRDVLTDIGCDFAEGLFFAPVLSRDDMRKYLEGPASNAPGRAPNLKAS